MRNMRNSTPALQETEQEQSPSYFDDNDTLLTINEVARRLRVDQTTVRRWINNGTLADGVTKLPSSDKRSLYRVSKRKLEDSLNSGSFDPRG